MNKKPKITKLNFTYKKDNTDVWVLNTDDIPVDKTLIKDQQIVYFGPNSFGGNHTHPRVEWLIGIGDLIFVWLDENGRKKEVAMHPEGKLFLIEVPAYLPHAVVNNSKKNHAILFEYADAKMSHVAVVKIV